MEKEEETKEEETKEEKPKEVAPKEEKTKEEKAPAKKAPAKKDPVKKAPAKKDPAKKDAAKPKAKSGSVVVKIKDGFAKAGYMDLYDYITLGVGIWGFIFALLGIIFGAPAAMAALQIATGIIDQNFYTFMTWFGLYFIELWIYVTLALFPFVIEGLAMKILKKWPDGFPLRFIKNSEDFRGFMVFAAWWSAIFFWIADPWMRWPHFLAVFALTFVLMADLLHKKISKMPRKKIKEV